ASAVDISTKVGLAFLAIFLRWGILRSVHFKTSVQVCHATVETQPVICGLRLCLDKANPPCAFRPPHKRLQSDHDKPNSCHASLSLTSLRLASRKRYRHVGPPLWLGAPYP